MGSLSPLSFPIVKFSAENLKSGTAATGEIRRALEEFGGFQLLCDDDMFSAELHKARFGLVKNLFDLPVERKWQHSTSAYSLTGYIGPKNPPYEGFEISYADKFESIQDFANLMWSEQKLSSSEIMHSYSEKVSELMKTVKKLVLECFGVEKYYASIVESLEYNLRLVKYTAPMTPMTTEEIKSGLVPHTDKSFCTILQQNPIDSLEVQTKNGEWIRVSHSPSSFIFLVGDGLYAWTNGRVHCPPHRVIMKENVDRYTIGLFTYVTNLVECPKELIDEEHPLLFKPFDQRSMLKFCSKYDGPKDLTALKAFCGVKNG